MTRLDLNYSDFEDYLKSLGKSTRKNLRRKFRKTESTAPITLEVRNDVTEQIDEIYPLYLQVHERSRQKFERLTKEYFCNLGKQMPERTRFFIWRQNGKAIAFSLCMVHGDTIYDEYLGLDYSIASTSSLFLYAARHHHMVAGARTQELLQQSAELRSEASPWLRSLSVGPVCHTHQHVSKSDLSARVQVSRTDAARSGLAAIFQRASIALTEIDLLLHFDRLKEPDAKTFRDS